VLTIWDADGSIYKLTARTADRQSASEKEAKENKKVVDKRLTV